MIPDNFQEAITSDEAKEWTEAMNREMNSLAKNETWRLVSKPADKQPLDVKWIYRKKAENKFKARWK